MNSSTENQAEPAPGEPDDSDQNAADPVVEKTLYPAGHFYSPEIDRPALEARRETIWRDRRSVSGIDFNDPLHRKILSRVFPRHLPEFDYPQEPRGSEDDPGGYYLGNSQYAWLDARALFVMLRWLRPRRMIEVGAGFSSLLTADVNRRFLGNSMKFTCIEPYPRPFLQEGFEGMTELIEEPVEKVPLSTFTDLRKGDILFIDSSHVSKTGSDVNYLMLEILPVLRAGVIIHVHDIFLPNEYPTEWVLDEGRSWNEQYLLQALLIHSSGFEVMFGSSYAHCRHRELLANALGMDVSEVFGGCSLWLRRNYASRILLSRKLRKLFG